MREETPDAEGRKQCLLTSTIHDLDQLTRGICYKDRRRYPYHHPNPSMIGDKSNNKTTSQELPTGRFLLARDLFQDLIYRLQLQPSTLNDSEIDENLAVAFLVAPERLVWADHLGSLPPAYLGHQISKCQIDGYFVAALLVKSSYDLVCTLALPCTHMQIMEASCCQSCHAYK